MLSPLNQIPDCGTHQRSTIHIIIYFVMYVLMYTYNHTNNKLFNYCTVKLFDIDHVISRNIGHNSHALKEAFWDNKLLKTSHIYDMIYTRPGPTTLNNVLHYIIKLDPARS